LTGQRWLALDGLRGVAILLVIIAHASGFAMVVGGMVGVTLFFVLSGFLITSLLIREIDEGGSIRLGAFYGRRALRLLPALGVYLAGVSVLIAALRLDVPVLEITWPPALYVANYAQVLGMDLAAHRHTWSLAVEEHFYLVWPILVGLGATRRIRPLAWAVVLLIGWRFAVYLIFSNSTWGYLGTDTNAFALGVGAMLAAVRAQSGLPRLPRRAGIVSVASLCLLSLLPVGSLDSLYEVSSWATVVAAGLAAVAVVASVDGPGPSFLRSTPLRWFGLISYSLYLWHAPVLRLPGLAETPQSRFLALALGIGVAFLSWKLVEQPILNSRLRKRLEVSHWGAGTGTIGKRLQPGGPAPGETINSGTS
jgi:peptidoglycan/LPS O-acetylase OafA/YrhL